MRVHAAGEAKDHFSEVFLGGRVAAAPDHLLRVDVPKRLKRKVSLPDENGAGFRIVDQAQKGDRSGLQFERAGVHSQRELFAAIRIAQAHVAELAIDGVGIRERHAFFAYLDAGLLRGDRQAKLKVGCAVQVDRGHDFVKALLPDAH